VDLGYTYNHRNETAQGQIKKNSVSNATISYNLFNGFTDLKNMQSAQFLRSASSLTYKAKTQDIVLSTKESYIDYLDKRKNLTTYLDAYKLFSKQYEDARAKYDQGLLAKNDLLQVNVNLLDAKQNVTEAKRDLKVAKYNLSNILGGYDLTQEAIDELSMKELDIKTHSLEDIQSRSELRALKMNVESLNAQSTAQKGTFLPSIDASYSVNKFGDDESVNGREGYPNNQKIGTVQANWSLYNGGFDYAQIKIFNAQKRQTLSRLEKTKLDIKLQYETAVSNLDVAKENFETAKLALEQAKENYSLVNNRYLEGLSSTTDLIDANYLLSQAKQRYSKSYYDKFLSIATLKRVLEHE
jgi:outer membrane protein TolC